MKVMAFPSPFFSLSFSWPIKKNKQAQEKLYATVQSDKIQPQPKSTENNFFQNVWEVRQPLIKKFHTCHLLLIVYFIELEFYIPIVRYKVGSISQGCCYIPGVRHWWLVQSSTLHNNTKFLWAVNPCHSAFLRSWTENDTFLYFFPNWYSA